MKLLGIFQSGGLWILPLACLIGAAIFFRAAYKRSQSGSYPINDGYVDRSRDAGNTTLFNGFFWLAVALVVAAIVIFIAVSSDYKNVN